jgi:phenylacetate-CoA ligase
MVRYRTRDLTRLMPGTARTMRRIERINGRSDDMLIVHGVNIFPSQIEELVLADKRLSPHYRLELHRQGHLDRLEVVVEGRNGTADPAQAQACSRDLAHHVKAMIGVSVHVRVESEGAIERSLGKAKRVVDFRSKE